ncbi:hypothetical protein [Kozakia baliensis]|nr:hypothetical protein [Kozakia baliensis]
MTITQSLISFIFTITLLVLTPGLDTALVLRRSTARTGLSGRLWVF